MCAKKYGSKKFKKKKEIWFLLSTNEERIKTVKTFQKETLQILVSTGV